MDALAIHPYPENSTIPPTFAHPNTTHDRDRRLREARRRCSATAFDGTGQPGSTLPILYAEYGVETQIPAAKASLYTGTEPATIKPVPEATQAQLLQAGDADRVLPAERDRAPASSTRSTRPALDRFQSGLYYPDGTPKSSLAGGARRRARRARRRDREVPRPRADAEREGRRIRGSGRSRPGRRRSRVTCDIDCTIYARLERLPTHTTTLVACAPPVAVGERTLVKFPTLRARARAATASRFPLDCPGEPGRADGPRERAARPPMMSR